MSLFQQYGTNKTLSDMCNALPAQRRGLIVKEVQVLRRKGFQVSKVLQPDWEKAREKNLIPREVKRKGKEQIT